MLLMLSRFLAFSLCRLGSESSGERRKSLAVLGCWRQRMRRSERTANSSVTRGKVGEVGSDCVGQLFLLVADPMLHE